MKRWRLKAALIVAGVFAVAAAGCSTASTPPTPSPSGNYQHETLTDHGDTYNYAVYVPRNAPPTAPLVVVLHGCGETPEEIAAASQYDALADRYRFIVVYPDVDSLDLNAHGGCWTGIWAPNVEGRGSGDAGAVADMTTTVATRWHTDPSRVYAIGISAGAFEAASLGMYYPDLYAAIGMHSGAVYMGSSQPQCLSMTGGTANTDALPNAALAAMGTHARVMPVVVIHGDADDTIPYTCGQQAIAQWLSVDNLLLGRAHQPAVPTSPQIRNATAPGGRGYSVDSYDDSSGCTVAQLWTVHGMGHFWSGGSTDPASAQYSDPSGPSASAASWEFFSQWALSAPPCRHS